MEGNSLSDVVQPNWQVNIMLQPQLLKIGTKIITEHIIFAIFSDVYLTENNAKTMYLLFKLINFWIWCLKHSEKARQGHVYRQKTVVG